MRIILKTADVSETGSMTEAHPDDIPGTSDYSCITKELSEKLMDELVDWLSSFVVAFKSFEVPEINVSGKNLLRA